MQMTEETLCYLEGYHVSIVNVVIFTCQNQLLTSTLREPVSKWMKSLLFLLLTLPCAGASVLKIW